MCVLGIIFTKDGLSALRSSTVWAFSLGARLIDEQLVAGGENVCLFVDSENIGPVRGTVER